MRTAFATLGLVLLAAALLERWPSSRSGPVFADAVALADGRVVFAEGAARRHDDRLEIEPGVTTFLVRTPEAAPAPRALPLLVGGTGLLELPDRAPLVLRPEGARLELPLEVAVTVTDRAGHRETLLRQTITLAGDSPAVVRFDDARESVELPEGPVR